VIDESLRQQLATRVARLEQQIRAFKELHATELGLILDELAKLRAELTAMAPMPDAPDRAHTSEGHAEATADPAAGSPKRAKWLAEEARKEQERNAPLSRRDLLRGRERDESG
jgi:hypothetical protein